MTAARQNQEMRSRHGRRPWERATNRVAVVLYVIGALGVASITAGCGAHHSQASAGASPLEQEFVDYEFPATGAQYAKGNLYEATVGMLQRTVLAHCLTAHGWNQTGPQITANNIALTAVGDQDNTVFPNLAWMSKTGLFVPDKGPSNGGNPVGPKDGGVIPRAERPYIGECEAVAARPLKPPTTPLNALVAEWNRIVERADSSPRVQAAGRGFGECVEQHGVPAAKASSLFNFLSWVTGLEARAPTRSSSIAVERHWVKVFIPCATRLVHVQERLQNRRRRAFIQDHYQEITAADDKVPHAIAALEKLANVSPAVIATGGAGRANG